VLQQRQRASAPRACEAESAALQALCHAKQEKFAAAYGACNQAIQIASDLPDPTCLIACLQTLAFVQVWDGEAETALPTLERALELAIGRGDLPRQYTTHGYRGFALMNARRPVEAAAALQLALEMSENLKLPFMAAMFSAWLAGALVESGRADEAVETARHAVRLANERNEPWARSVALRFLGQALAVSTAENTKLVNRILRSAQEIQSGLGLPFETAHTAIARNKILRALH
jgi:tetratricopeptide (TPR) repeat protein